MPNNLYDQTTHIAAPSVYEPVARGGAALGAKHLILSGAPAENADQLKAKIDALNAAGRFARSTGVTAAYHNHWWEFESKIGEIEALYTQTDPELVHFVLDAGHAFHGGADVPAFIRAHAKRIIGFHLRDFKNDDYVELGTGDFPLHQVAATIEQIGWKGWVENEEERADHSQAGDESDCASLQGHEGGIYIVNRREFLYTGAVAAAAAARSMDARAYAAIPGANDRVGLGVIGLGRRGTIVCGGFVQDPRVEIRALADIYDKQVADFQGRFKEHVAEAEVSVEYQKMLDRKDVDAVLVSTPDHLHVEIAKDTLGANKHTYLEKPTLHRWSERGALTKAAEASKAILQCGMQQRSGAHYQRVKQEIFDSGQAGSGDFCARGVEQFSLAAPRDSQ